MGLTIFGAILGLLLGLFVAPVLQPYVTSLLAARLPSRLFRARRSLQGEWNHVWKVESKNYPGENISQTKLTHFLSHVHAEFSTGGRRYQVKGRLYGDFITGVWEDLEEGHTYHGAFQLRVLPNANVMEGVWVGWGRSGEIKSGQWNWTRIDSAAMQPYKSLERTRER